MPPYCSQKVRYANIFEKYLRLKYSVEFIGPRGYFSKSDFSEFHLLRNMKISLQNNYFYLSWWQIFTNECERVNDVWMLKSVWRKEIWDGNIKLKCTTNMNYIHHFESIYCEWFGTSLIWNSIRTKAMRFFCPKIPPVSWMRTWRWPLEIRKRNNGTLQSWRLTQKFPYESFLTEPTNLGRKLAGQLLNFCAKSLTPNWIKCYTYHFLYNSCQFISESILSLAPQLN